jgi:hypothetical protein
MEQIKEDMVVKIDQTERVINQVHMTQIPLMEIQLMVLTQEHQERKE